jgi:hypothetical protein
MRFQRTKKRPEAALWTIAAGVALTGLAAYAVSRLLRSDGVTRLRDLRSLEKRVLQALLKDERARTQGIDIAGMSAGTVEVSGQVETQEDARHIVELIGGLPGVHSVLNRMEIRSVESQLQRNRQKSASAGSRWYGGSVGMGRPRQGTSSDPDRYDDRADMLTRALQPNLADTLTDVEETEDNGVRIGATNSTAFNTHVPPHSPDSDSDEPGPPPPVAPHHKAQRQ